jgi:hypothetical protein
MSPIDSLTKIDEQPIKSDRSDAPRISVELEAVTAIPGKVSLTLPANIIFKLRRAPDDGMRPCLILWSPYHTFADADIVLLHMTEHGADRVHIDPLVHERRDDADSITVTRWTSSLQELQPTGEPRKSKALPMRYQQKLKPGETYQLLWLGGEVDMWDWGDKTEHVGKKVLSRRMRGTDQPQLTLAASAPITFTATDESEPWPERPDTTSEAQFQIANIDEQQWRLRRTPRASRTPLDSSDRK